MAVPSIVQSKFARSTSAVSSLTATFDSPVVSGRLIVAFGYSAVAYPTISDNQGGSYGTQVAGDGYDGVWGRVWKATAGGGTTTVTVTPSGSQYCSLYVFEVANWNSSTPIDKSGAKWDGGLGAGDQSPIGLDATQTSYADELFLAVMVGYHGIERDVSNGTGWSLEGKNSGTTGQSFSAISKSVVATGSYDPTWNAAAYSSESLALGVSLVGGTDGPPGGGIKIASISDNYLSRRRR
jgi:hypothetical protein